MIKFLFPQKEKHFAKILCEITQIQISNCVQNNLLQHYIGWHYFTVSFFSLNSYESKQLRVKENHFN